MGMRDLRDELRQRLQGIALEKATYRERLVYLDKIEEQVKGFLEYETMRVRAEGRDQTVLFPEIDPIPEGERSALSQFLRDALMDGNPRSLDDLKRSAQDRNFDFGEKNPGRVLHFALLGMAQSGVVTMVEKGVWRIAQAQ